MMHATVYFISSLSNNVCVCVCERQKKKKKQKVKVKSGLLHSSYQQLHVVL